MESSGLQQSVGQVGKHAGQPPSGPRLHHLNHTGLYDVSQVPSARPEVFKPGSGSVV